MGEIICDNCLATDTRVSFHGCSNFAPLHTLATHLYNTDTGLYNHRRTDVVS